MNYLNFLISRKWWGFTLVFMFFNVTGIWSIITEGIGLGVLPIFLVILNVLLIIFSWNEYKLKYPDGNP